MSVPAANLSPTDLFLSQVKPVLEGLVPPINDGDSAWAPPRDGNDPLHQAVTTFAKKAVSSEVGLNRVSSLLDWIATTFRKAKDGRINNAKEKTKIINFLNDYQVEPNVIRNYSSTFEQNEIPLNLHITIKSNTGTQSESFQVSVEESGKAMDLYKLSKLDLDKPELEFVMSSQHNSRLTNPNFSSQDSKLKEATRGAIATIVKTTLEEFIGQKDAEVQRLTRLMSSMIDEHHSPEAISKATFQPATMTGGEREGDTITGMAPNNFEINFKNGSRIILADKIGSGSIFANNIIDHCHHGGHRLRPQAAITSLVPEDVKAAFDERLTALLKKAQSLSPMS